jgi:hypothetical protein
MKPATPKPPCVSVLFLLLLGAGATAIALWLIDHRQAVPNSGIIIAALIIVFFVSCSRAFLRYLRWRDQGRVATRSVPFMPDPALEGTVYGMRPGHEYEVMKSFTDHYGNLFEQGERLRFQQRHFLPYHGGHTIVFDGRTLYLQEDQNREILDNFSEYLALVE